MPFTAAELEEMRRADEEIEREFRLTPEDLRRSREQDRQAELDALPTAERLKRAYQRAYREANRDKVLEAQRAYYEANREKLQEAQRVYREANRDKVREGQRWIRDERVARGYTQRELAALAGVSQPAIAQLETGSMRLDAFGAADRLYQILGKENPRQEAT